MLRLDDVVSGISRLIADETCAELLRLIRLFFRAPIENSPSGVVDFDFTELPKQLQPVGSPTDSAELGNIVPKCPRTPESFS